MIIFVFFWGNLEKHTKVFSHRAISGLKSLRISLNMTAFLSFSKRYNSSQHVTDIWQYNIR